MPSAHFVSPALQTAGGDGNGSHASSPSSAQAVPPQLSYVVLRGLDLLLTKSSIGFQRDYGTHTHTARRFRVKLIALSTKIKYTKNHVVFSSQKQINIRVE